MAEQSRYAPLSGPKTIRLLVIEPGLASQPVSIQLFTVDSPAAVQFDALSYVWGDCSLTQDIVCDGRPFPVTLNLYWALQRVRHHQERKVFWVDAICINQDDLHERNHQVTLMGAIYSNALIVYLCMGDDFDGGAVAVQSIVEQVVPHLTLENEPLLKEGRGLRDDVRWFAVAIFTQCPWFQRAWVLQEAGLAQNPRVLYGQTEFSYRDFIKVLKLLNVVPWSIKYQPATLFIHIEWSDWRQPPACSEYTFLDLLSHGALLQCSDPRDHICSFLGHPFAQKPDGSGLIVRPDYEKDPRELFLELTQALLQKDGIRVLSMVEHDETSIVDDFPSWIVRWNVSAVMNDLDRVPPFFHASTGVNESVVCEGNGLLLQGVVLDTVRLAFRIELVEGRGIAFHSSVTQESFSMRQIMESLYAVHGETMVKPFCQTICANESTSGDNLRALAITLALALDLGILDQDDTGLSRARRESLLEYWSEICAYCVGRSFVVTDRGLYALSPRLTQPGDRCCILLGANVPFVIRPNRIGTQFRLLGETYVHSFMDGQVAAYLEQGLLQIETIVLC
jgi:hypothetical protein